MIKNGVAPFIILSTFLDTFSYLYIFRSHRLVLLLFTSEPVTLFADDNVAGRFHFGSHHLLMLIKTFVCTFTHLCSIHFMT